MRHAPLVRLGHHPLPRRGARDRAADVSDHPLLERVPVRREREAGEVKRLLAKLVRPAVRPRDPQRVRQRDEHHVRADAVLDDFLG